MTLGVTESVFLGGFAVLVLVGLMPRLSTYRPLLLGSGLMLFMTAILPRPGNILGLRLFSPAPAGLHLPIQLLSLIWWILGAWLVNSALELVLRRTVFPNDDQPHARRLFADLASALVYVVAFVGIIQTVWKQPLSAVLATSGVLAIVLGLALQNTLADVFSGLALNIERSLRAGDWIALNAGAVGEIMEINWRALRMRTAVHSMIVIPNSIVAKAIITSYRRLSGPLLCVISLTIAQRVDAAVVIAELKAAALQAAGIAADFPPTAYAREFADSAVTYDLFFGIENFARMPVVRSEVICRVSERLRRAGIALGPAPIDVNLSRAPPPSEHLPCAR